MTKDKRNLLFFFLATFLATWSAYGLILIKGWDPYTLPGMALLLIGGSAPSWVAVLLVLFTRDKSQRRGYFIRCFSVRRVRLPYGAFICLVFPLLFALVIAVNLLAGGALPGMENLKAYLAQPWMFALALVIGFFSGPWSEEFGWRGYALDPLLKRFGPLGGSILLGLVWGLWHLPLFFMPQTWHGKIGFGFTGFWTFILYSIGLALMMSWVYLQTDRSIFSAFLMHLAANFTGNAFTPYEPRLEILRMAAVLILGLALCLSLEHRRPETLAQSMSENIA